MKKLKFRVLALAVILACILNLNVFAIAAQSEDSICTDICCNERYLDIIEKYTETIEVDGITIKVADNTAIDEETISVLHKYLENKEQIFTINGSESCNHIPYLVHINTFVIPSTSPNYDYCHYVELVFLYKCSFCQAQIFVPQELLSATPHNRVSAGGLDVSIWRCTNCGFSNGR